MNPKITRYLYPSIIIAVVAIIVIVFVFSALFISRSIDVALKQEQENAAQENLVSMNAYQNAKEKLGLTTSTESEIKNTVDIPQSTSSPIGIEEKKKTEDKALLSIAILNSTGIKGKAAELSTSIVGGGFKVSFTGNAAKREAITLIKTKETTKQIFPTSLSELTTIVGRTYKTTEAPLESTSEYDVVIIIGAE